MKTKRKGEPHEYLITDMVCSLSDTYHNDCRLSLREQIPCRSSYVQPSHE